MICKPIPMSYYADDYFVVVCAGTQVYSVQSYESTARQLSRVEFGEKLKSFSTRFSTAVFRRIHPVVAAAVCHETSLRLRPDSHNIVYYHYRYNELARIYSSSEGTSCGVDYL
jgi:hypothetical protein